ncbi:MAG: DNA-3-methyladenine glycosylase [Phycisphaeraceae bacterium]|nr:DNA-3-methyladenine glycosylase [Phycisphaeraceae bacterium]
MRHQPNRQLLSDPARNLSRLTRSFLQRDTVTVARGLLGQLLVRQLEDGTRLSGLIVETEAYLGPDDRAAHTYNHHRSPRNESMWQQAATAYVYFTYGMHHCINIVTRDEHSPQAVLIRALQPVENGEAMRLARPKAKRDTDLCSGPAKLCEALAIDRGLDGIDLTSSEALWLERARQRAMPASRIAVGPRIGIANSGDWADKPLRFAVRNNPHVSKPWVFTKT